MSRLFGPVVMSESNNDRAWRANLPRSAVQLLLETAEQLP
ncbi:MAG: hypothetical protein KatS3mg082_1987 [Nitrospiraceae bacterium]|nr:MAG: hypothetical protein KatS3mg082_1987 [Nitrospiraceae bacterium]